MFFCLGLSSCSQTPCLGASRVPFPKGLGGVEANIFARAPTFDIENWRPSKKTFVWPLMELSSMKLKSFRRGQAKMFFAWPPTFGVKSWRSNANFVLHLLFLELSSMELNKSKKGQGHFLPLPSSKET